MSRTIFTFSTVLTFSVRLSYHGRWDSLSGQKSEPSGWFPLDVHLDDALVIDSDKSAVRQSRQLTSITLHTTPVAMSVDQL